MIVALNMDQKRASFALAQVAWLKEKDDADDIRTQSAKFIALILNSGFLQAMDFASIKLNGTFVILNKWFAEDDKETGPELSESIKKAAANGSVNQKLAELDDINEYRRVMEEAVVFLGWVKSKAEGKKMELKNREEEQIADRET
jgi:CRISPR/Cas system CMR-associated protein Cmr5 small subunit